jgi:hypothetical protein
MGGIQAPLQPPGEDDERKANSEIAEPDEAEH